MTNEEKAKEIAENQYSWYSDFYDVNSFEECYESAIAMAESKDKEHAQERHQWIDKAAEWLRMTMDFFNNGEFNTDKFVNDFKQEMNNQL